MADPLVAFDVRRGRIFVGDGEQLGKLFKYVSATSPDEEKLPAGQPAQSGEGSTTTVSPSKMAIRS